MVLSRGWRMRGPSEWWWPPAQPVWSEGRLHGSTCPLLQGTACPFGVVTDRIPWGPGGVLSRSQLTSSPWNGTGGGPSSLRDPGLDSQAEGRRRDPGPGLGVTDTLSLRPQRWTSALGPTAGAVSSGVSTPWAVTSAAATLGMSWPLTSAAARVSDPGLPRTLFPLPPQTLQPGSLLPLDRPLSRKTRIPGHFGHYSWVRNTLSLSIPRNTL